MLRMGKRGARLLRDGPVSSQAPGGVQGPGKQRLAKRHEGNPVLACVGLRVAPCRVKLVMLVVVLHGPALMDFDLQHHPRLGCKYTRLLPFRDHPGCDAERIDISVLAQRCRLPFQLSIRSCAGLSPAPAPPMTGTDASLEHLSALNTWQLRGSPSQSGILSLIPLNGFPMNLSS